MTQKMVRKIAVLLSSTECCCHWVPCKSDDSMTPKTVLEFESYSCFLAPERAPPVF